MKTRGIIQKLSIGILGVLCFAGVVRAQSAAPSNPPPPEEWEFSNTLSVAETIFVPG